MTHGKHTEDVQRAQTEVGVTDIGTKSMELFSGFLGHGNMGRSDFEAHELNAMIDLVENATPSDLEKAGQALWSARDAIRDAANELKDHIGNVDWDGKSGTDFRTWGGNLVTNTLALADYADAAALQITAAGSGLASVRSSMPPRDTRPHKKKVEDIPAPKRVEGNAEYDEAVKVEGHRQEAINQMNRLASFYSVTSGALSQQKPPRFEPMPNVGVPKPQPGFGGRGYQDKKDSGESLGTVNQNGGGDRNTVPGHVPNDPVVRLERHDTTLDEHRPEVGTKIDTVQTLPPTAPPTDAGPTPTHTGPNGPAQQPVLPTANGFVNQNPTANGYARPVGNSNTTPQARGSVRDAAAGRSTANGGRTPGTMGRSAMNQSMNQAHAAGRTSATGRMPMGRGGVTGGTPRSTGTAKSSSAGAVRKGGVVGGRPTSQTPDPTSRVPKGNVIGGGKETPVRNQGTSGTSGKAGQRGVIGAPNPQGGKPGSMRRAPGAPEGVVGAPKERSKGPKGERAGFTSGGSGLVRGRGDQERHQEHHGQTPLGHPHHRDLDDPPAPQHRPPHGPPETE